MVDGNPPFLPVSEIQVMLPNTNFHMVDGSPPFLPVSEIQTILPEILPVTLKSAVLTAVINN
jgi:hypothetical protein